MRHPVRLALTLMAGLIAALLAAPPDRSGAWAAGPAAVAVDTAAAARLINDYRASHGLPPVKVEARLTRIAAAHSARMAATDRLDHVLPGEGSFMQRIAAGGYPAGIAAENIGAGQDRLADVIAAWKTSPAHNANLLQRNVTEIGIALSTTPAGTYHTYWTLVLAAPAAAQPAGVSPGPLLRFFGG